EGVPDVPLVAEVAEALRRHGLPPGAEVGREQQEVQIQSAEDAVQDQLGEAGSARLEVGAVPLLRPLERNHDEDHWPLARPASSPAPVRPSAAPAAASRAGSRSAT